MLGEANFSDHGANRLGASALMQGLADGYFVLPYTIGDYLARGGNATPTPSTPRSRAGRGASSRSSDCSRSGRQRTVDAFHRELGRIMWDKCGMARNDEGLEKALAQIPSSARSSGRT